MCVYFLLWQSFAQYSPQVECNLTQNQKPINCWKNRVHVRSQYFVVVLSAVLVSCDQQSRLRIFHEKSIPLKETSLDFYLSLFCAV